MSAVPEPIDELEDVYLVGLPFELLEHLPESEELAEAADMLEMEAWYDIGRIRKAINLRHGLWIRRTLYAALGKLLGEREVALEEAEVEGLVALWESCLETT